MGLVSFATGLARTIGGFLGGAPSVAARAAGAARAAAPSIGTGVAGAAAFEGARRIFAGDGVAGLPVPPEGPPLTRPTFITLEDGSRILVSPSGVPARAQLFLPSGAKLPAGSTVVSVSPDGQLFGIRRARRRRTFQGEVDRCRQTISAAEKLLDLCKPKKR